jgi:FtsP/CotA-like multicopper oxidase with cupredoxin domain
VATKSASSLKDSAMPKPYQTTFAPPPVLVPDSTGIGTDGKPVAYYTVTQKLGSAAILPGGPRTPVLGYNGVVPGPTISVDRGTRVELRMRNRLPATHPQHGHPLNTSTHLHGSASKPQYDGFANDVTYPGHVKTYKYPNFQPARTLWYHDHGVHATAQNAYSGLAAQRVWPPVRP